MANDMDTLIDNCIPCHIVDTPEICNAILTTQYQFKILTLNIRSLNKNFSAFSIYLHRFPYMFDVIILTECWLTSSVLIEKLPGYMHYYTQNNINQNGGVVAYIRNNWQPIVTEMLIKDACCLNINIPKVTTILGIYRPPSFRNSDEFLTSLDNALNNLAEKRSIIIAGDINIDILVNSSTDYICLLSEHGLEPAITKPTRQSACLDHIFVKSNIHKMGVICNSDLTDHKIVMLGMMTKIKLQKQIQYRTCINYEGIIKELQKVDWGVVTSEVDSNAATESFMSIMQNALKTNTKLTKIPKSKFTIKPWITPGLLRCSKHRDRLHAKLKKYPNNEILKITYTRYKNFYNELIRKLKVEYERKQIETHKTNPKHLWKTIQSICNLKIKSKQASELTSIEHNPKDSLNLVNDFFCNIGKKLADNILLHNNLSEEILASSIKDHVRLTNSFFMTPTNVDEVTHVINNLKSDSAPGLDLIDNKLIKSLKTEIINPLLHIINLSLSTGCFPSIWKVALVTPIHKDGSKDSPSNYRPISLLSTFSKILEKIVNKRLINYIEKLGLLSPRQFGFRQKKSTEDAVTFLINLVSGYLDEKKHCVGIFLDLAKAFDTVSTKILLKKLENLGIRGIGQEWFKSYLSDRQQLVGVGSCFSDRLGVHYGVPQGSILGPTLFILYINDLLQLNILDAEIICYADDTVILFNGINWTQTFNKAENGISILNNWFKNNLLTLNSKKTKYLCFHKTSFSQPPTNSSIRIHSCNQTLNNDCNCDVLERTDTIKYLGVILDDNLNFKAHIHCLSKRIRKTAAIFKKLRESCSLSTIKTVYYAICHSLINYCIPIWGSAGKTVLIEAEKAQRAVLKTMLKKPFRYPTRLLYEEVQILTIRKLYILRICLIMHKEVISSSAFKNLIEKRVFNVPLPTVNSSFGRRFGMFIKTHTYNAIQKDCVIFNLSFPKAKTKLNNWLLTLEYNDTENLLH